MTIRAAGRIRWCSEVAAVLSPEPAHHLAGWHWCNKCQILTANVGPCDGGGQHDHTGSGDYMLQLAIGADTVLLDQYKKALNAI